MSKTTIGGLLIAIGSPLSAASHEAASIVGNILISVGAVLLGYYAHDGISRRFTNRR